MLGPRKGRCLDRSVLVSLEALVPRGHFYRDLEAKLDLGFVRELAQDRYEATGRPSIDPVVFFKLQLIMFFEGIRSERRLIEVARLNLAHRWYLGYHFDEPLPEHSSLTRIRDRLGVEIFHQFFERIVALCQAAGLVWGKELLFDATQVRANAGLDSLVPRFYLRAKQHVEDLFVAGSAEATPADHEAPDSTTSAPEPLTRRGSNRSRFPARSPGAARPTSGLSSPRPTRPPGSCSSSVGWIRSGTRRMGTNAKVPCA